MYVNNFLGKATSIGANSLLCYFALGWVAIKVLLTIQTFRSIDSEQSGRTDDNCHPQKLTPVERTRIFARESRAICSCSNQQLA